MIGALLGDAGPARPRCSRAGCGEPATSALRWRNPRIHTDGREKTWLACAEHVAVLESFLGDRGFPVRVEAFEAAG